MGVLEVYRELRGTTRTSSAPEKRGSRQPPANVKPGAAIWQIVVADVSMSLDNVLAVAGAAKENPESWRLACCRRSR